MSSFIAKSHHREPIEWREKAYETLDQDSYMIDTAVALFAGLGVASFISPVAGVAIAAFMVKRIFDKENSKQEAKDLVIKNGLTAPFLEGDDFTDFLDQAGSEAVCAELKFADDRGVELSDQAWDFLQLYELHHQPPQIAPVNESKPAVGTHTRLGAVTTAATEIEDGDDNRAAVPSSQSIATASPALPSFNPVDYLVGDRLRTSLIVSVSGGGKDVLLSNALRSFLPTYPKFNAIVMDCKDDSKETGYYANLERVKLYRLNLAISSDSTIATWIDAILDDFNGRPENCLLICNEGTLIREKSKRYSDVVKSLVSSGDSRQKYCWEAGQSAHNDDLKTNGASRSRFRPLMIGMLGEEMQIEAVLQAKWFADSARDMSAITSEMRRSPVSRAWCDGMRWYPMPELVNYCGYDRDSRSFVESQKPSENNDSSPQSDSKANIKKPNLPLKDIMLACAMLAEWIEENPGLSFDQMYGNYNAARKGFKRPEFRFLLTKIDKAVSSDTDDTGS